MFVCERASVYDRKQIDTQCPVDGAAVDSPSAMPILAKFLMHVPGATFIFV